MRFPLEVLDAVRAAVGAGAVLCADANMGFTFATARRYVEGVADAAQGKGTGRGGFGARWIILPAAGAGLFALARSGAFTRQAKDVMDQARSRASELPEGQPKQWYVIHTYSGYENKVKANLEHRIESMGVEDQIFQVLVPMEEEIEIRNGQRQTVNRKVFPGYVLVEMAMSDESWYVVRNTPGVTSFVGSGNRPLPLGGTFPDGMNAKLLWEFARPIIAVSITATRLDPSAQTATSPAPQRNVSTADPRSRRSQPVPTVG